MRELRYSILSDINDGIDRAKQGKLALYWQRNIEHEYRCKKVTPAEQQAYTDLQDILAAVPQWSDEEELRSGMEGIGGRVWFCYFWEEHDSMVQLKQGHHALSGKEPCDVWPWPVRLCRRGFAGRCCTAAGD